MNKTNGSQLYDYSLFNFRIRLSCPPLPQVSGLDRTPLTRG